MGRRATAAAQEQTGPADRGERKDDRARLFHEAWLGYAQPREGLVFSIPVLVEADCHDRHGSTLQSELGLLCRKVACSESDRASGLHTDRDGDRRVAEVEALLAQVLGFRAEDLDQGEALPSELHLEVQEGPQDLRPTLALRRRGVEPSGDPDGLVPDASTPASRAGARYSMLVWKLPDGLAFDRAESTTGAWAYPPTAKFDRLLRACRVPIGLLANGDELRLFYAPPGGASGTVTFRFADMVDPGVDSQCLVDAFKNLLGAHRFFAVAPDRQLPALLRASRDRQEDVTKALAGQVLDALGILVLGVERASERSAAGWLDGLLDRGTDGGAANNELYEGLLTVLLRLVFCLYAEDKGLLPSESAVFQEHYSVHALFDQLQANHATYPDTMDRRFGAWSRLLALFRAIHGGVEHADFVIPPRHGEVFDPHRFAFLEHAGGRVPAIDDETVFRVLEELIVLEGQRLSYRALETEQLGSVYEGLMGFRVERLNGAAVCLRGNRVWVVAKEVVEKSKEARAAFLEDELGVERSVVKRIAAEVKAAKSENEMLAALALAQAGRAGQGSKGRLVVQPGLERRRTSSHYTPRALTERVVSRALEPLLGAMGGAPGSERLLNLKICDPAMGSGAFLVAACRFLGEQVVAAWTREGKQDELGSAREDALLRAKRLVAQRCLYGVDKNHMAVSLAKLSLWLETMAREEPFTFVDHALRHGDSLVGLDLTQIRAFDWDVERRAQLELPFGEEIDEALGEALHRRQRILDLARRQCVTSTEKAALLRDAEDALERPRLIADVLMGAWFAADTDKAREAARLRRKDRIVAWLQEGGDPPEELRVWATEQRARAKPFHWMIELPEVFFAEREDPLDANQRNQVAWMDAFVGNPPFMGGRLISGTLGEDYASWIEFFHQASLNADLAAHFFRRASHLLGEHGTVGMVATKTIAQGDTRTTGIQRIVNDGAVIYDAVRNIPWPGEAAVSVALLHLAKGRLAKVPGLVRRLDGREVETINSRLLAGAERPDPQSLRANEGLCYQGAIVLGMGFVLTPEERAELVRKDAKNGKLIFPYLGGEEVNTSSIQDFDRYVINFGEMTLKEAEEWPELIRIVREKVKPERGRVKRDAHRKYWWHFADKRPALTAKLGRLSRCLVSARTSKHLTFTWQPCGRVFSENLVVFALDSDAAFTVLQSRIHGLWVQLTSSTFGNTQGYRPSDCLATFPFPSSEQLGETGALVEIGKRLYGTRAELMRTRNQGLTVTYNQLKDAGNRDSALVALRRLHEEMDRAVLDAYGWSDLIVPPFYTPATAAEVSGFERFSDTVIDRLFALNAARAAEEADIVATAAPSAAPRRSPKRASPPDPDKGEARRKPAVRTSAKGRKAS